MFSVPLFLVGESYLKLLTPQFWTSREKKKCDWYCFWLTWASFRFQAVATLSSCYTKHLNKVAVFRLAWFAPEFMEFSSYFKRRDSICQIVLLQAKPQAFLSWVGERCHTFDISIDPSPFACVWGVLDIEQIPYIAVGMCRVCSGTGSNLNKVGLHIQCKRKNCLVQMLLEFNNSFLKTEII